MAAAYRVPHSQFLGWDRDDRDKAIAHHLQERSRCTGCGLTRDQQDEAREQDRAERGRWGTYVGWPVTCPGCRARAQVGSALTEKESVGRHIHLYRREDWEAEHGRPYNGPTG